MTRGARRVALWVGLFILALLGAGVAAFVAEPVRAARWMSRQKLDRSLDRVVFDAPAGHLVYWRGGTGPTMVLVHGMGDQAGTWNRVAGDLARTHRLLVPDLPGHGGSDPLNGPLPVRLFVQGLWALLDREAPGEAVTLVGNSLGGGIALQLALERPERVERIWGLGSAALFHDVRPLTLTPANRGEALALIDALSGPSIPAPAGFFLDDYIEAVRRGATPRVLAAVRRSDYLDGRLGAVRAPVHLIWGEADDLLPLSYGRQLQAEIPNATLDVIPNCGHVPQWECPEALIELIERR